MDNRSKSILLQVAFKAAVDKVDSKDIQEIGDVTEAFYHLLVELHQKLGFDDTTAAPTAAPTSDEAPVVTIDGEQWYDYRGLKELGAVKATFPDFKRVSDGQGKWLTTKNGSPTKFAEAVERAGV